MTLLRQDRLGSIYVPKGKDASPVTRDYERILPCELSHWTVVPIEKALDALMRIKIPQEELCVIARADRHIARARGAIDLNLADVAVVAC